MVKLCPAGDRIGVEEQIHQRPLTLLDGGQELLHPTALARKRLVDRACELMLAQADEPLSMLEVCRRLGTSRRIVDASPRPVYLAGGLRADNVAEAIATVQPHGLDLCSGVRSLGRLDAAKLQAFMAAVRNGDARRASA